MTHPAVPPPLHPGVHQRQADQAVPDQALLLCREQAQGLHLQRQAVVRGREDGHLPDERLAGAVESAEPRGEVQAGEY